VGVSDEIKDRIDIVEFISGYVPLQKTGRNYKGLCPFHADTTPSFVVFPDGQRWHCFGACATGGDIFTFLTKKENLDFSEALRLLAQRAGIPLAPRTEAERVEDDQRRLFCEINAAAAQYYHHLLLNSRAGQVAREYLAGREIADQTRRTFQLGYALPDWEALSRHLMDKGYQEADMLAAGLTVERESGGYYDRFRGRLIFPILDEKGGVVGFGGRALDDSLPKYVNTPQTPLFDKGSILYGIHVAKGVIRDEGVAIIAEGYMDVLMAHQHGFKNVVASMGTALTENQVRALRRLTRSFILAMDADAAGEEASLRGLEVVKKHYGVEHRQSPQIKETYQHIWLKKYVDANIKVITMPGGQDPDDVIRKDPEHWAQLVEQALPLMDYYFQVAGEGKDLDSAQGKSSFARQLLPLIREIGDGIERSHYLQKLAHLVRIDERTLAAEMARSKSRDRGGMFATDGELSPVLQPLLAVENYCLLLLLKAPDFIHECEELMPADFLEVENLSIFLALLDYLEREEAFDVEGFRATLDPLLAQHLGALLEEEARGPALPDEELRGEIERSVARIKDRNDRRELEELESLLRDAQAGGDADEEFALKERIRLVTERRLEREKLRGGKRAWSGTSAE
jgi:DNA primase